MDNFDLKKFLIENKITRNSKLLAENEMKKLSSQEQATVNDILGENYEDSLNEADLGSVIAKIKEKAKQGLLTAAVVGALLTAPSLKAQQSDIKKAVSTELSVNNKFDQGWETLKSQLSSTKPMLIASKDYSTGLPFQSLNWGTASNKNTGGRGAIAIMHDKGSKTIRLDFFSSTDPEVTKQLIAKAKEAGIPVTSSGNSAEANIPVDQISKVVNFIKISTPILKGTPSQEKAGGSFDIGSNTGQMQAGPASKPDGSVKIGGKTFKGF